MKLKKRLIVVTSIFFIVLICTFIFGIGAKRTDVDLIDYKISEDGNNIKMKVGVSSSAGYIKAMHVKEGGTNKYITFYSTFGINNKIGSKNEFEIEVNSLCGEIYFYTGDGGYKLVLKRNEKEEWVMPDEKVNENKETNTTVKETVDIVDTKDYDKNKKIAYSNENDKENSNFIYSNIADDKNYNWKDYIVENKIILKDMPEIDFTEFQELDNDFYCLKITDYNTYIEYSEKYNLRKLSASDFDNIFVEFIIRKSTENTIKHEDIIKGYEYINKEDNYTFPITVGGYLDVTEEFKYPCMIGYFPNYMNEKWSDFYFKVLVTNENIKVSKDKALEIAQKYLSNLSYKAYSDFSWMDFVRIERRYANNFLNTEDKETPIEDTSKKYLVWSISAYSMEDPCTWANVYVDVTTGKIIGGKLNYATD